MKLKDLKDLGALKVLLARQQREAAERRAAHKLAQMQAERERHLFAFGVGAVTPLPEHRRALPARELPLPWPRQRQLDEQAALAATLSDEMDVELLLETDEALSYRGPGIGPDVPVRLRRGVWAIQAQLDLHGLRRDQARERLNNFIHASVQQGLRCVRVVHGKGHGSPGKMPVLKAKVLTWLVQKQDVIAFAQARPADGGAGALIVLLRG